MLPFQPMGKTYGDIDTAQLSYLQSVGLKGDFDQGLVCHIRE